MNHRGRRSPPLRPLVRGITLLGGTTAFAAALLVVSFAPVTAASATWAPPDPLAWSNGIVLCEFSPVAPSVNVSAVSLSETGLTVNLGGMTEVRPDGSAVAVANLSNVAWQVANLSTDDAFDLAFIATSVPLVAPTASAPVVGSVDLRVDFVLPAYASSPDVSTDVVSAVLTVSNWTWQAAGDHLAADLSSWVTYPGSERLTGPGAPSRMITGTSTGSQGDLQWMGFAPNATVVSPGGNSSTVSASPQLEGLTSGAASVTVAFGASAGEFRSLVFVTQVGVILPTAIAGIPTVDFLAVAGAAAGTSLVVAVVAHRVRRRPSRLTYAEEET